MNGVNTNATKRKRAPARADGAQRILVVEDDVRVSRVLRDCLEIGGFLVSEARCAADVVAALKSEDIALMTLDLTLKHEDGLAIARTVRAFSDVAIVMVSARSDDIDRIIGLEVGADDYIIKPFNVREVIARVRAVLRRTSARCRSGAADGAGERILFAGWTLDCQAFALTAPDGRDIPLTAAEFRMLQAFATHPRRVLARDMLLDLVGGADAEPLERSIDTIVSRLRRKIEADPTNPQLIKTMRGAGYVFAVKTTT